MKVIFLDIDGVLKDEDYDAEFKDECFARLKKIIDATDAQIILSSSWRISYWEFVENGFQTDSERILDLYRHFEKYDIKVSGRTGYTERSVRKVVQPKYVNGQQTNQKLKHFASQMMMTFIVGSGWLSFWLSQEYK